MAIEGPLRELGIHDVFQLLDLSRKTGVLRVSSELREDEGVVYFDDGRVVHASIRSKSMPIELVLLEAGRITQADLDQRARGRASDTDGAARRTHDRRFSRSGRRDHAARAGASAPLADRERGVRADVVARGFLLVRGTLARRDAARHAHRRVDRVAVDGRGAPHRRVVAHRRRRAEPRRDSGARAGRRRSRGRRRTDARPPAARVAGPHDDRRRSRSARDRRPRSDATSSRRRRSPTGLATTGVVAIRQAPEPTPSRSLAPASESAPSGLAEQVSAARAAVETLLRRAPTGAVAPEARDALEALARLERVLAVNAHG